MENRKIINHNNLTKTTFQKLLNEPFSMIKDRKESILNNFVDENNISCRWKEILTLHCK